ncbi:hypothetical protein [Ligilactobacillus ruminis]|uniref:Uncharacterized protein n=1 Tax=Ligilactobacillus ruminis DPC 6832 TaxID=1402208 RepID=A0A837DUQ5_9LACO|nr:hypothetical protein [Ligilactobacillus ruminis]KIC04123.1 hypothetical protein LRN_0847 [Ligilactobacillus ruminis DPC 6832]NME31810.1 hypothetical protein [Ligilactobacillus ruminis]
MNQRIIFALTVIGSVLAASIGSSFHIAIITKVGYCILAIALLIAGFLMLVLKHTEILSGKDQRDSWEDTPGEVKAVTVVGGLACLVAGAYTLFQCFF